MKYKLEGDPAAEALCNPEKITEALRLAAQDARRLHKQTGHPIVVWEDGSQHCGGQAAELRGDGPGRERRVIT